MIMIIIIIMSTVSKHRTTSSLALILYSDRPINILRLQLSMRACVRTSRR